MVSRSELIKLLPEPKGRQADVLALRSEGHVVVLGTAGSGKTTLAMLRALKLSDPRSQNAGRTLLVTYNRALLALLRPAELADDGQLEVRRYHHFARGYLSRRGALAPSGSIVDGDPRLDYIKAAVGSVGADQPAILRRGPDFAAAEIAWIARHGIQNLDAYQRVDRTGRLAPLERGAAREGIWRVYERYRELRAGDGYLYDWEDIAGGVREALANDDSEPGWATTQSASSSVALPRSGTATITAFARNGANAESGSAPLTIRVDRTAPQVTWPRKLEGGQTATVRDAESGLGTLTATTDGKAVTTACAVGSKQCKVKIPSSADGQLRIAATDQAGNTTTVQRTVAPRPRGGTASGGGASNGGTGKRSHRPGTKKPQRGRVEDASS